MTTETIFITGAAGLLGGAVLFEALRTRPELRWTALIRGPSEAAARQRLADRLARSSNAAVGAALAARVDIVVGDLFQLDTIDPAILGRTTRILHLAADTSYWSKESNWRTNFDGTMALAEAAMRMPKLTRFLHCGTATICGREPPAVVHEDDFPRDGVDHIVHYTYAKACTETALAERFPTLPVVIARPSICVGHTTLGARPTSSILWFVRVAEELGLVTCDPDGGIDIVPFDWTAQALLLLLTKPALAHRVYHVSAGTGSRSGWKPMAVAFARALGRPMAKTPLQFGLGKAAILRERFAAAFGRGDARLSLMLRGARKYYEFAALDVTFDNTRLLAEGMPAPPSLPEYISTCVNDPPGLTVLDAFLDDIDMFDAKAVSPVAAMVPEAIPALA